MEKTYIGYFETISAEVHAAENADAPELGPTVGGIETPTNDFKNLMDCKEIIFVPLLCSGRYKRRSRRRRSRS